MRMRRVVTLLASLAMLTAFHPMVARAHHSAAMYDFTRTEWLVGTVKEIRVMNPHTSLVLVVSNDRGSREIRFEGHGANNFYRVGWRANLVKVGDRIRIRFNPRKEGGEGGFVTGFVTSQGKQIMLDVPSRPADVQAPSDQAP